MKRRHTCLLLTGLALTVSLAILPGASAQRGGRRGPIRAEGDRGAARKGKQEKPKAAAPKNRAARSAVAVRQQDEPLVPVSAQAVAFAVTRPVAELEPDKGPGTDTADPDKIIVHENDVLREAIPGEPFTPDAALQTSAPAGPSALAPAAATSFDGISNNDNATFGIGRVLPPDTVGDVGPNHYVQAVNLLARIYQKNGTPVGNPFLLSTLFTALPAGNVCRTTDDGDPIVLYDELADRWLISQFSTTANPNTHQCIAISKTGDPAGQYYVYDFQMPNNKFNDYPHFGIWPDAYYMTDNQFNQAGTAFQGAGYFAFNRAKMLAGDPTANFVYFDSCPTNSGCVVGGVLPADADGLTPPPAGAPAYFAYFTAGEFGDPSDAIRIFQFDADFATPANSTFTTVGTFPVAAFDPRSPSGRNDIEQPSPGLGLDSIQDRVLHRLQYRNFGSHESLVVAHTVNVGANPVTAAGHQAAVRYYELRRSLPGGSFTVPEQATFAPDTENRWMPSAAMDNQGNIAVGYSVSSSATRPAIRYAGRLASDPANSLAQGETTLIAGTGVQTHSSGRWGDYSSMTVDPVDDCTFWYTTEYYTAASQASSAAGWLTRVGAFKFPTCQAPPQGTAHVTVTNCETAQPVAGASVSFDGNLYGTTGAGGTALFKLTPGVHSVGATAPGYSSPVTTVNVVNGQQSGVGFCLNGVPSIQTAGSSITAESCAPADNAAGPGETVTMDLALKNTGTASSTNLVATLVGSGGVTPASGPQTYGAVAVGGPAVSRPFTFTLDPSLACGAPYTVTLQLQDGATNLGTVSYAFNAGALGATVSNIYTSGNIATPLPDLGTVDIPVNVPNAGSITDVNVRVRLNHTFDGDLVLSLVHPDGTVIPLSNRRGGSGDNFGTGANDCSGTPTVFDDAAAANISGGVAPFAGSFKPESPLAALNGKTSSGTWKLRVSDAAAADVGTAGCVQLEITRQKFVCCGSEGPPLIEAAPPAVLVAEGASPANNAPDPEETVTVNFPVRNIGDGPTTNLVATLLPTGGVAAPSGPQTYGAVQPNGVPVARPFTFVARGNCGDNITATLRLQDGATDLGTVTYTMRLGTTTTTTASFTNGGAAINIPAGAPASTSGPAGPYPSAINVSGVAGAVSKVTVVLKGVSHTFPDDIDVLLVGPGGQKLLLMSDAGGSPDAVNANVTFDDAAPASVPDSTVITSGTFRPTNYGTGDNFAAPAPAGPHPDPQLLSVFNGLSGAAVNGQWRLFVTDDAGGDVGSISGGWELHISTASPSCVSQPCTIDQPQDITVNCDAGLCGAVVAFPAPTYSGSCGVVTASPASGSFFNAGTTTVSVTGRRADNSTTAAVGFNVTAVDNQNPSVDAPPDVSANAPAGACEAAVNPGTPTVSDNCSATFAGVRSDNRPLSDPYPVGTTTITWTATDPSGNAASDTQTVTVYDVTAPTVSAVTASPEALWPPDHRMVDVALSYTSGDSCPGGSCAVAVTSNEAVDGLGDGDTAPDWAILSPTLVRLRAERAGGGTGRVYTITITCTDASGNSTSRSTTVSVPHSQKR